MQKTTLSLLVATSLSTLQAANTELQKITVTTPTKSSQSIQNITSNINVITSEDIEERRFTTVAQALSTIPGFNLYRSGGLGQTTSLMMRGLDNKRILVLMDGVRLNDTSSLAGADLSHIMTDNIARIEVLKGAQSGIWGADATAGVINIITKKATKDGLSASIYGEYGSYNSAKYGINTTYKKDAFDMSLNLGRSTTDGFSAKSPAGADVSDYEDDAYTNNSADLKAGYNITKDDRIEGFYTIIDTDTDYDGFDAFYAPDPNDTLSSVEAKEQMFGLTYLKTIGATKTKFYANRSLFDRYYPNGYTKNFTGSVDEIGLNTAFDYDGGALSAGLDHKKFKHSKELSESYDNTGIFISNYLKMSLFDAGQTIFSQGFRYDAFSAFANKMTCRFGLKQYFEKIDGLWISANYAGGYNVPTLYQLYDPTYGNSELNAEKSFTIDTSIHYKNLGLTYYQNRVDDMIGFDYVTYTYANIKGMSKLNGLELTYANSVESLSTAYSLGYTYQIAEDRDGNRLLRRPKNSANFTIDYYGLKDTHVGALVQYIGKRDDIDAATYVTFEQDSYTVVDLTADYTLNDALTMYVKIENALDEEYQQIDGYATPERSYYAGFRYKLK